MATKRKNTTAARLRAELAAANKEADLWRGRANETAELLERTKRGINHNNDRKYLIGCALTGILARDTGIAIVPGTPLESIEKATRARVRNVGGLAVRYADAAMQAADIVALNAWYFLAIPDGASLSDGAPPQQVSPAQTAATA